MKRIFVLLALAGIPAIALGQSPATDSLYIVTYTTGPAWDASKPPGQQPGFMEHSANLSAMRKEGAIKFGARYGEKGIIFLSAASLAAAKARVGSDPAIVNGLFLADIQRLKPFYYGCIDKPN